jgi:hypothetical protein
MHKPALTGSERGSTRALLAGLFAAALTAVSISHLPGIHFSSWGSLLVGALLGLALVSLAAFLSSLGMGRTRSASDPMPWRAAFNSALIAAWLAPIALFSRQGSMWILPAVGIFVTMAGISLWPSQNAAELASPSLDGPELFTQLASRSWSRQAAAFAAVFCAEAGAATGISRHLLGGTLLVVLASGVLLYVFRENWKMRSDEPTARRALSLATLAIVFTAIGLLPLLRRGYAGGPGSGRFAANARHESSQTRVRNAEDGYIAIELWPEQRPTPLVAPMPVRKGTAAAKKSSPQIIPFSGVYWFFKAPDLTLPPAPREAHGSPEMFNIHSTDRRALSMQARQNLGTLVDLSCCSSIRIGIRNSDRYPGTVSIELVLTDTSAPGRPSISLGRKPVRSTRPWMLYDHRPPTNEVLEYPVPPNSRIHRFDEVMVIFWLDRDRSFAAAKMGIENFVLVPHGA